MQGAQKMTEVTLLQWQDNPPCLTKSHYELDK
jgi:hypothetical protein